MSEKALWAHIKKRMGHMGHLVRIENGIDRGTPDVNGCVEGTEFWLELKEMPHVPRGEIFLIPHYTPHQRMWLRARGLAGGRAFLFLRIIAPSPRYYLWGWRYAFESVGRVGIAELQANALLYQGPEFDPELLLRAIRGNRD